MSLSQHQDTGDSAAIQSLPTEILSEVFCKYVALDDSPWRLTLVCRRWHHAALSTPGLWTRLVIVDKERFGDTRWVVLGTCRYSRGRATVCHDAAEVRYAFRLAGVLPLHIAVDCDHRDGEGDNLETLMGEVFCSALTSRIVALNLNIHPYISFATEYFPSNNGQFGLFPNLEILEINLQPRFWLEPLVNAILTSSASSLRYLQLPRTVPENKINDIIAVPTHLERLDTCSAVWPLKTTPTTRLSHLKQLRIKCSSHCLGRLGLPQVQGLVVHDVSIFISHPDDLSRPELPELVDLRVTTRSTKWIEGIVAPKLRVLCIRTTEGGLNPPFNLLSPNAFPSVEVFTFETAFNSEKGRDLQQSLLISALQAVPNAVSVKIATACISVLNPEPRIEFLDRLSSVEEEEILCPRLRNLRLISRTRSVSELDEYEVNMLQRVFDNRKQIGRGLSRFIFQWTNEARELITHRYA
jgi:F-box-like